MAHITGGGLPENLERILGGRGADLSVPSWELGAIQKVLEHVNEDEAFSTFNMGVGWVVIVDKVDEEKAMGLMSGALRLGEVKSGDLTVKTV